MEEGMEKRLLLSFALSILVLFGFGWFYSTPAEETAPPAVEVEPAPQAPAAVAALAPAPEAREAATAEPAEVQDVQAEVVSATTLLSGPHELSFSNEGAVLTSVRLRDYIDGAGQPLELIGREAAETTGWPLGIRTGDPETDAEIESALFAVEGTSTEIRMEYAAGGLRVGKTFRVAPDSYRLEVEAEVRRDGDAVPFSLLWQGSFGEDYSSGVPLAGASGSSIVYRDGLSFERLAVGSIEDPNEVPATMYAGVADRYFVAMFLLSDARPPRVSQVSVDIGDGESLATPRLEVPYTGGPVGLYVGPQQEQRLTEVDPALADVIDYGFFGVLSRPMMFGLALIHDSIIDNWGWSIIVLTIFINFVFFPLRLKQQLSMQKMQKIQPQMRTLQDKYKKLKANDPRRPEVQAEMMGLYKKHGVNPLGGCLPLLLQMPFLIAMFGLLQVAIELRQAPWVFWIQDLAAADPYYVLPVMFGLSMFAQQKTMPTVMDPMQARIMMIMPVMLTVMFFGSPSGLMLYWLTSTLFGVGQQFLIRKYWAPPEKPKRAQLAAKPEEKPVTEAEVVSPPEDDSTARRKRRRKK